MSSISLLVHLEDGGRYNEQIVIVLNSVARTAIACKGELMLIALTVETAHNLVCVFDEYDTAICRSYLHKTKYKCVRVRSNKTAP